MNNSQTEQNKELVRRFVDGLNQRNLDVFDELLARDFVDHTPAPGVPPTREGWKSTFPMEAFPDLKIHVEDMIGEDGRVAVRSKVVGTHQGEFMSVPTTGKEVSTLNITIFGIDNGKIIEKWTVFDALGMMAQVGAIPPPG
ncbi:MAG TPA: ester cyclase [Candidatus Sulfomarinibacteraceae bacterium]|nr:ester cyclase [Candidatus Sulfomarinibacteraceae bacterium]